MYCTVPVLYLGRCWLYGRLFGLLGRPPGQVALVLLALGVGQVARLDIFLSVITISNLSKSIN